MSRFVIFKLFVSVLVLRSKLAERTILKHIPLGSVNNHLKNQKFEYLFGLFSRNCYATSVFLYVHHCADEEIYLKITQGFRQYDRKMFSKILKPIIKKILYCLWFHALIVSH